MKKQLLEKNLRVDLIESNILPYSLMWYRSDYNDEDFMLYAKPMWSLDVDKSKITKKSIKEYVEKQIKKDVDRGYLRVNVISPDQVEVVFNSNKWLRENFLDNPKIEIGYPRTLMFKFKRLLPDGLMKNADWIMVSKWLRSRFYKFLKENKNKIFGEKKLLKMLSIDFFEIVVDLQMNYIYLKLKPQVLMALGVGGYLISQYIGKNKKINSFKGMG